MRKWSGDGQRRLHRRLRLSGYDGILPIRAKLPASSPGVFAVGQETIARSSDTDGYVQQLVERYLDHDIWFRQRVRQGLEQLDRGEYLTHEEVGDRIERMFHS
jgi:hypothetical protein